MLPTSSRVGRIGLTAALAVFPMLAGAQESPDLVGMWSGKVEAGVSHGVQHHEPEVTEPTFGNYELTFTLTIEKQEGRALIGTWSSPNHSERIFGVLRRDNASLHLVDEDSDFDGLLLSSTTMELCLTETHDQAMGAWCLHLEKQAE